MMTDPANAPPDVIREICTKIGKVGCIYPTCACGHPKMIEAGWIAALAAQPPAPQRPGDTEITDDATLEKYFRDIRESTPPQPPNPSHAALAETVGAESANAGGHSDRMKAVDATENTPPQPGDAESDLPPIKTEREQAMRETIEGQGLSMLAMGKEIGELRSQLDAAQSALADLQTHWNAQAAQLAQEFSISAELRKELAASQAEVARLTEEAAMAADVMKGKI